MRRDGPSGYVMSAVVASIVRSDTVNAWVFTVNARWAMMRLTSSVATCTFEFSRNPPWIVPATPVPGADTVPGPDAAVSTNVVPPTRARPGALRNVVSVTVPTATGPVGVTAVTVPSAPTVTSVVPAGTVTAGARRNPR